MTALNSILVIIVLAWILIKMSGVIVSQLEYIAKKLHAHTYGVAAILAAIATSLPELFVAITSAINKNNQLSLGNIMGSNIANISITLGLAALLSGSVKSSEKLINQELIYAFLISCLPMLLLFDGNLSQVDGLLLCGAYGVFMFKELVKPHPKGLKHPESKFITGWKKSLHQWANSKAERHLALFAVAVVVMLISAEYLTVTAVQTATIMHIPIFVIGLIIISLGTTLPELAFEIIAIKRHESNAAFGNILGSIAVNATLILGLSALINPIVLAGSTQNYHRSIIGFITIFGIFWYFVKSKHRLERWEGGVLVLLYLVFAGIQML